MDIKRLDYDFSICKVPDFSRVKMEDEFCFTGRTDKEYSLVCITESAPENAICRDDGWRAFRIEGTLDFSLVGILAGISALMAENGIGIFAVSTYDTDYILVKAENFSRALDLLAAAGHRIL